MSKAQSAIRRAAQGVAAFLSRTPQRKWTAVGAALGLGTGLIVVPPLGIAAYGGAIAGSWLVVLVVMAFGALIGNRAGVEVERRRDKSQ